MSGKRPIGFIGFGNMARAIASGILSGALAGEVDLIAYNPTRSKIDGFAGVTACDDPGEVARRSDLLFLCFKPQQLDEALSALTNSLRDAQTVVSIMAGVSAERICEAAGRQLTVLRAMPDTPLLVGCGATAVSRPGGMTDGDYELICDIFRSCGEIYEIPADKFNEVIPVAGSAVALLFRLARLTAENARRDGLDYDSSLRMFAKAMEGAAAMIERSGRSAEELERMVCSKGGTTLAMLDVYDARGLDDTVRDAWDACVRRARELGGGAK